MSQGVAYRRLGGLSLALLPGVQAAAQLPLSIEQLLVEDSRLTATASSAFLTRREPVLAGNRSTPALVWRDVTRQRTAAGLRYGLTARLEVNATAERMQERWDIGTVARARSRAERLALGANWLAFSGGGGDTLLLDLQVDALARAPAGDGWRSGAGGSVGATWYRSLDPVVLSLSAHYGVTGGYRSEGRRLEPGDRLFVAGAVNFAVNHQVTLVGGLSLQRLAPDRIDGRAVAGTRTTQALDLGVGYAPTPRVTLFVRGRLPGSSARGGTASVELLYQF